MHPRRNKLGQRRGNAAVELAITLPAMATIILGSVEVCGLIYNKQALVTAAYECAGVAINATGTNDQVQARLTEIATQRGIVGAAVRTTPANIEKLPRGNPITVLVTAPVAGNSLVSLPIYGPSTIQAKCVMVKEL